MNRSGVLIPPMMNLRSLKHGHTKPACVCIAFGWCNPGSAVPAHSVSEEAEIGGGAVMLGTAFDLRIVANKLLLLLLVLVVLILSP